MILVLTIAVIIVILLIFSALFLLVKRSEKSFSHIIEEIKYEINYNILGARAMLDDYVLREKLVNIDLQVGKEKVALITGGARGIGSEVVKKLLKCDFQVIIGCRNVEAAKVLYQSFQSEGITLGEVYIYELDLASIKSIKLFAEEVKRNHPKIHLLINNAGKMFGPYMETKDGYESQFGTNYLGHFLLTHLLLSEIKAAGESTSKARIVNVSSCAHLFGNIEFDDINQRKQYISSKAYASSKLAQILFSNYLSFLLEKEGVPVAVYSLHPGIVNTDLFNGTHLKSWAPWIPKLFFMTPEQGATTTIFACLSPQLEKYSGVYITNCQIMPMKDVAYSAALQKELFEFTCNLLGIEEFGKF